MSGEALRCRKCRRILLRLDHADPDDPLCQQCAFEECEESRVWEPQLICAECGVEGPRVQMCEPLSPDHGKPMPLCPECWHDYVNECEADQAYQEQPGSSSGPGGR